MPSKQLKGNPSSRAQASWKDRIFTLHLWLGLFVGAFFSIACLSGTFLALHPQVEAKLRAWTLAAPKGQAAQSADQIMAQLPSDLSFSRIEISPNLEHPWKLRGSEGNLYVSPHTGVIKGPLWGNSYAIAEKIHRWLLFDSKIGRPITGALALSYLIVLLTGLGLRLSKLQKNPLRALIFTRGRSIKRRLYDAHLNLGLYAAIPLILMVLTGLYWSYRDPYRAVLYRVFDGAPQKVQAIKKPEPVAPKKRPFQKDLPYQEILDTVRRELPQDGTIRIQIPRQGDPSLTASKIRTAGPLSFPIRDDLKLDPQTGKLLERRLFADKTRAEKVISLIYDLHSGAILGNLTFIVWLLACLSGASLPLTGALMWRKRQLSQKRAQDILARRQEACESPLNEEPIS